MMMAGMLTPAGQASVCTNGTDVYLANISTTPDANEDGNMTFTFTIVGGVESMAYDVFSTTNFVGSSMNDSVWTWLGKGTNCGAYYITNQAKAQTFYLLGGTLAADGSGLTIAYERLISSSLTSDPYGTPTAWYLLQGLNPQTISGIGSLDPDLDGILNNQEYLYGTNPQISEGFGIWVSEPSATCGIP